MMIPSTFRPPSISTSKINVPSEYAKLRQEYICFIADTYSMSYVIDTAVNWLVLNYSSLMTDLKITTATIKGVGGIGVQIYGAGKLRLHLKFDDGKFDIITDLDLVFVPLSPCNLIPPQILIKQL